MTRHEGRHEQNDARPGAAGRASHQQESSQLGGSTLVSDTVALEFADHNGASSRIDPDTRGVQWTVVGLVGLLGLTSFLVSFRALHDVAAWAGIGPGLQWAVPVFIDGAILTYALAVLVHRSRGEAVWPSWVSLAVFTAMSVAANAAHAVAAPQEQWWQTLVGAALAALAPLGVFAATEQMARLVVLRPQDRDLPADVAARDVISDDVAEVTPAEESAPEPGADAAASDGVDDSAQRPAETEPAASSARVTQVSEPDAVEPISDVADSMPAGEEPAPSEDSELAEKTTTDDQDASEEEDFAAWVREQRLLGEPITGPTAGAFLGVSERTGRNRIKELRAARPELFEEEAA